MKPATFAILMRDLSYGALESVIAHARLIAFRRADDALYNFEAPYYHHCATGSGDYEKFQSEEWKKERERLQYQVNRWRMMPFTEIVRYQDISRPFPRWAIVVMVIQFLLLFALAYPYFRS